MSNYNDYKKKALSNKEVKIEYDALQPEYDLIQAAIDDSAGQNIAWKEKKSANDIVAELTQSMKKSDLGYTKSASSVSSKMKEKYMV